jgi:hypothetical protein
VIYFIMHNYLIYIEIDLIIISILILSWNIENINFVRLFFDFFSIPIKILNNPNQKIIFIHEGFEVIKTDKLEDIFVVSSYEEYKNYKLLNE